MPSPDRDRSVVEHMLAYCKEIRTAHDDFDCSYETFQSRSIYRNAIALCLLQIGELANHLSCKHSASRRFTINNQTHRPVI